MAYAFFFVTVAGLFSLLRTPLELRAFFGTYYITVSQKRDYWAALQDRGDNGSLLQSVRILRSFGGGSVACVENIQRPSFSARINLSNWEIPLDGP